MLFAIQTPPRAHEYVGAHWLQPHPQSSLHSGTRLYSVDIHTVHTGHPFELKYTAECVQKSSPNNNNRIMSRQQLRDDL